ncbi:MAG TPA: hypothetical protein VN597_18720 [Streptosporangiaceae bacterium]|nr:hypothetical protein [Streptosporangiaceae bacterium]
MRRPTAGRGDRSRDPPQASAAGCGDPLQASAAGCGDPPSAGGPGAAIQRAG